MIGVYTVFVGAEAPVMRAAIMGTLLLLAGVSGRRGAAEPAIALAAALMVALEPRTIDDLSFQLSFAATASLAAIAGPAHLRLLAATGLETSERTWGRGVQAAMLETAVVTAAAVAATLPLIALHFGRISLVALPANLLVVPLFPLIFLGSLATAIAGSIDPAAGEWLGWLLAWLPLSWFVAVAQAAAALPLASASIDGFGLTHAIVLYGALIGVAIWLRRGRSAGAGREAEREAEREALREARESVFAERLRQLEFPTAMTALGGLLAVNVVVWGALAADDRDTLDAYVLDVGQGDAILAVTPSRGTLLVDGGADGQRLLAELAEALPAGQRRLDVVVATHPQADHVAGLFAVLDRYRVGTLLVSPLNDVTDLGRRLRAAAESRGIPVREASAGMLLDLGGGVLADVLAPAAGFREASDVNAGGVVLRLRHGAVALLLTADIGAAEELALAGTDWDLRAQALKVGHHGSGTSATDLLLRRVSPGVAVISVGASNGFGHPRPEVLARLNGATAGGWSCARTWTAGCDCDRMGNGCATRRVARCTQAGGSGGGAPVDSSACHNSPTPATPRQESMAVPTTNCDPSAWSWECRCTPRAPC